MGKASRSSRRLLHSNLDVAAVAVRKYLNAVVYGCPAWKIKIHLSTLRRANVDSLLGLKRVSISGMFAYLVLVCSLEV